MSEAKAEAAAPSSRAQILARYSELKAKVDLAEQSLYQQQMAVDAAKAELIAFESAHRDQLASEPSVTAALPPLGERDRQNRNTTNSNLKTMKLVMLGVAVALLILLLLWGLNILPGSRTSAAAPPEPLFQDSNAGILGGSNATSGSAQTVNAGSAVAPRFQAFYDRYGTRVLGLPISGVLNEGGLEVQWFERARLEYHPNLAGTPYEVQLSRLGSIYTDGRSFAEQQFFVSRPDARYFDVTRHGVGGIFLDFWQRYGGLDVFGYPISAEFDELLPDGNTYRVQYFERARLEYHPALAGTDNMVQVGLLGTALYQNDPRRPQTVQPIPTPVPLP
jgi:hypothetical protein